MTEATTTLTRADWPNNILKSWCETAIPPTQEGS